jgi:hypothetical protein
MQASSGAAPSTSSPTTVALVLTSGIYPGPFDNELFSTGTIAAASDGSVWLLTIDGLWTYSSANGFVEVISLSPTTMGPAPNLAPVNADLVYYITGSPSVITCYQSQNTSTMPALPGGDTPNAISAAADGTLWAQGASNTLYAYDAANGTWTQVASPPGTVLVLSVGSASYALALVNNGGPQLYSYAAGTWTNVTTAANVAAVWIGACLDGSYWFAEKGGAPVLVLPNGTVKAFAAPPGTTAAGSYAAGSRYGCYFVGYIVGPPLTFGILLAGYGVTEQPPEAWPAMTTDQKAAYDAIGVAVGITDPAGIRAAYANLDAALSDYFTIVKTMAAPSGVSAADWTIVQTQIENELEYAQTVQNLFQNIKILNVEVSTIQLDEYTAVVAMVGLPDNPNDQPQTIVSIILGAVVQKLFAAATAAAPSEVQNVLSVATSIYNFAADQIAKQHAVPDRNTALQIACAQLAGTLSDMQLAAVSAAAKFEAAILTDWGMLRACGISIQENVWYWPPNFDVHVLDAAAQANATDFYQALMPVKWQIMQIATVWDSSVGGTITLPNVPAYSLMYEYFENPEQSFIEGWWQVCADQSASPSIGTNGPFPNQNLIEALNAISSNTLYDFFYGLNGWNLPVAQMNGWGPPIPQALAMPWNDSTSPVGNLRTLSS